MGTDYPYEFPTSGFAKVDRVRHWLEDQPEWDYAKSEAESLAFQDNAITLCGYKPRPLEPEAVALNEYLTASKAGRLMTMYGWGLYFDLMSAAAMTR